MKKNRYLLLILFSIVFSFCSTEVDIIGDYKDYTIVYGVLNQDDSIHQFKITKAFLGKASAYEMAKVPDSSYYDYGEIKVVLEEWENGNKINSIELDTGFITNKKEGVFYGPKQMIYENKTPFALNKNSTFRLQINNLKINKKVSCEIPIVYRTLDVFSSPVTSNQAFIDMTRKNGIISWYTFGNAKIYYPGIQFNYVEVEGNDSTEHHIRWELSSLLAKEDDYKITIGYTPLELYSMMSKLIPIKENVVRLPGTLKNHTTQLSFYVKAFDKNFYTKKELSGGNDNIFSTSMDYTNVENGIGLVFSKSILSATCQLEEQSINELLNGSTKNLNFKNW